MKTLLLLVLMVGVAGCQSNPLKQLPKDSAMVGAVGAYSIYGHGEVKGVILTGNAVTPENMKAAVEVLPNIISK